MYICWPGGKKTILVAKDLPQSCILGVDFMRANGLIIDFNSLLLKSKEENVPLKTENRNVTFRVTLARTVVIPPSHEMEFERRLQVKDRSRDLQKLTGLVEPTKRSLKGKPVLLSRTLVRSDILFVPLRISNFDNVQEHKYWIVSQYFPRQ